MTETLGSGWSVLVWWTWPTLFAVQFLAVWVALRLDSRTGADEDVRYRCGALVGELGPNAAGHDGYTWCALPEGHADHHRDEYGATPIDYAMAQHGSTEDTVALGLARLRHDINGSLD